MFTLFNHDFISVKEIRSVCSFAWDVLASHWCLPVYPSYCSHGRMSMFQGSLYHRRDLLQGQGKDWRRVNNNGSFWHLLDHKLGQIIKLKFVFWKYLVFVSLFGTRIICLNSFHFDSFTIRITSFLFVLIHFRIQTL